jgi:hypothetical protein
VGAGKAKLIAQRVHEQVARLHLGYALFAVDLYPNRDTHSLSSGSGDGRLI